MGAARVDFGALFNDKESSSVEVVVGSSPARSGQGDDVQNTDNQVFYLHRDILLGRSRYFHSNLIRWNKRKASGAKSGQRMCFPEFLGGPPIFAILAKHCYTGEVQSLHVSNVLLVKAGAEYLGIDTAIEQIDLYITTYILPDKENAVMAVVGAQAVLPHSYFTTDLGVEALIAFLSKDFCYVSTMAQLAPDLFLELVVKAQQMHQATEVSTDQPFSSLVKYSAERHGLGQLLEDDFASLLSVLDLSETDQQQLAVLMVDQFLAAEQSAGSLSAQVYLRFHTVVRAVRTNYDSLFPIVRDLMTANQDLLREPPFTTILADFRFDQLAPSTIQLALAAPAIDPTLVSHSAAATLESLIKRVSDLEATLQQQDSTIAQQSKKASKAQVVCRRLQRRADERTAEVDKLKAELKRAHFDSTTYSVHITWNMTRTRIPSQRCQLGPGLGSIGIELESSQDHSDGESEEHEDGDRGDRHVWWRLYLVCKGADDYPLLMRRSDVTVTLGGDEVWTSELTENWELDRQRTRWPGGYWGYERSYDDPPQSDLIVELSLRIAYHDALFKVFRG